MSSVCLYFNVHQPFLLKSFSSMDIDVRHTYFDMEACKAAIHEKADRCYLPCNKIMTRLINKNRGRFRVRFSISGTTMELLQLYRPDVIDSFRKLVNTGLIEILAAPYYHSLSFLYSRKEFQRQLSKHQKLVKKIFGIHTTIFNNTALLHNNELSKYIAGAGFKGMLCEGNVNPIDPVNMPVPELNLLKKIYALENLVLNSGCEKTIDTWGCLQSLDHFEARESFQSFSNIVTDFEITLIRQSIEKLKKQSALRPVRTPLL
ncbi:hypothetical protein A3860_11780 [Niastella vici]|uniref:Glycoside hydrolase family 57 N-terminal domain-containing protein n=1 Tax=Niastella vici TaxID=1703345 RepID=A0A1V9FFW8_9BACT|nr:hypothetical protein [Niastella vici]OQP57230.1 hypothetical protein A3860_11780 [Niastella vici]